MWVDPPCSGECAQFSCGDNTHTHTLKSHEVDLLSHKSHCHKRSGGHNVGAGGSRNAKKPLQLYFMNMIRDGRVIMTHRDAIYNQHKLD